ncbi:hypothetical protein I6F35_29420 [Bradyrhizobium sp. BRP22]|uniref:hypothetical protein n=1 Tax=Bradyrhizobium sp. BRP22 TaxID=2793821 RepID=UPI001CD3EB72|nr:hypothetical protein [Bradyrhizobium sp. BRP22]MCA1457282.1 hypothetical protein [Bradyrhizobium sp. BRP22]
MSETRPGFIDSLRSAARENPLAAALVGGGALWLLMGDDRLKKAVASVTATASPAAGTAARKVRGAASVFEHTAPPTAPEMDNETMSGLNRRHQEGASTAAEAVSGSADMVKHRFDEGVDYARDNLDKFRAALPGKEAIDRAQSSLSDLLERQPLVLGAVGVAIGAAVAGALRTSDAENTWLGELSDTVKSDLETRADAVSQSVREAADTVKSDLNEAGAETVERLKEVGRSAVDAAHETVKTR